MASVNVCLLSEPTQNLAIVLVGFIGPSKQIEKQLIVDHDRFIPHSFRLIND
jgi:hypothetical protein